MEAVVKLSEEEKLLTQEPLQRLRQYQMMINEVVAGMKPITTYLCTKYNLDPKEYLILEDGSGFVRKDGNKQAA